MGNFAEIRVVRDLQDVIKGAAINLFNRLYANTSEGALNSK